MHLVEEFRCHLDLVDHDEALFPAMTFAEQGGPGGVFGKNVCFQQVDEYTVSEMLANPVAFPCAPGAPQKGGSASREVDIEQSVSDILHSACVLSRLSVFLGHNIAHEGMVQC